MTVKTYIYWRKICPLSELKMDQKAKRLEAEVSSHALSELEAQGLSWGWSFKPRPGSEHRVKGHKH